jgi:integrase
MRTFNRLSDRALKTSNPGKYHDGGGLYLVVTHGRTGINRSWSFRYSVGNGRQRYLGLGAFPLVTLAEARRKAQNARKLLGDGVDPIANKNAVRAALSQHQAAVITFRECADAYIRAHRASWRSVRHSNQWVETLDTYVKPLLGDLPVSAIDTGLVLRVLEPIWTEKTETASRIRSRIELILDWARVRGYRHGENPARWRGHLDKLLPRPTKVRSVKHHPALAYDDVPALTAELWEREGNAGWALLFLVLTAARTNEVLGAQWDEIDFLARVWTVPADRMKAGRAHRVPLSGGAIRVLEHMQSRREGEYVFPGARRKQLSPRS